MRAFRLVDFDGVLVVVIQDPRLAAAVKAFDYAWEEIGENGPDKTGLIIETLDGLFQATARLAS